MIVRRALLAAAAVALCAATGAPIAGAAAVPHARDFGARVPASGPRAADAGPVTSPPVRAPGAFDLLGFHWRAPAQATLHVRVREHHGGWSRWSVAGDAAAHGAPRASDPVWTGRSRVYQVRSSRPVAGLRAHFVRVPAHRLAATVAATRRITADGAPHIIPRSGWDPDHDCDPTHRPTYGRVDMAFVHHTVNANDYGPDDSAGIVLAMCRYHERSNGWWDIGYNFVVDRYGQIFDGRAGGVTRAVVGAQAQGYNSVSTGVANLGTFSTVGQTAAGLRAMGRLIGWKLALHGDPVKGALTEVSAGGPLNAYPYGTRVHLHRISGHRDGDATECPGNGLYAQLPEIRRLAAAAAAHAREAPLLTATADPATGTFRRRVTFGGSSRSPTTAACSRAHRRPRAQGRRPLDRGRDGEHGRRRLLVGGDPSAGQRPVPGHVGGRRRLAPHPLDRGDPVRQAAGDHRRRQGPRSRGRAGDPLGRIAPDTGAVNVHAARRERGGGYAPTYHWRVPTDGGDWTLRVHLHRLALYRFTARVHADQLHAAGAGRVYVRAVDATAGDAGGSAARVSRAASAGRAVDDVAAGRPLVVVELDLPVEAGEVHALAQLADVGLDRLTPAMRTISSGKLRPGSAAYIGPAKPPPKRRFTSWIPVRARGRGRAGSSRGRGPAARPWSPADLDDLGVVGDLALDGLAAARLEHRARDRVDAAPVPVAERVDRDVLAAEHPLPHRRLADVLGEEVRLAAVVGDEHRARQRAEARLDDDRELDLAPRGRRLG